MYINSSAINDRDYVSISMIYPVGRVNESETSWASDGRSIP